MISYQATPEELRQARYLYRAYGGWDEVRKACDYNIDTGYWELKRKPDGTPLSCEALNRLSASNSMAPRSNRLASTASDGSVWWQCAVLLSALVIAMLLFMGPLRSGESLRKMCTSLTSPTQPASTQELTVQHSSKGR